MRKFRIAYRDGDTEIVEADSLDEAWSKARRRAKNRMGGSTVAESVMVVPGQPMPGPQSPESKRRQERASRGNQAYFRKHGIR